MDALRARFGSLTEVCTISFLFIQPADTSIHLVPLQAIKQPPIPFCPSKCRAFSPPVLDNPRYLNIKLNHLYRRALSCSNS
jgi:hypothetical protein